jgi:ABC-type nitrate/sulfonate/bicarbonate transport system, ATPase component
MLRLVNVSRRFGEKQIVEKVSLTVNPGEIVCLAGPSGIGKTTLLEIMAGILLPDSGTVDRQAKPALMFQDDALILWLTAKDNITYVLPDDISSADASAIAGKWLQFFDLEARQYPPAMSGGMRRRLSLGRTFASGRRLILLDEPFAFLDEAWQKKVAKEIAAFAVKGSGILLTSHSTAFLDMPYFREVPYRVFSLTEPPIVIDA